MVAKSLIPPSSTRPLTQRNWGSLWATFEAVRDAFHNKLNILTNNRYARIITHSLFG
jgi:hypothetical protein